MRTIMIVIYIALYLIITFPMLIVVYLTGFFSKKKQYVWCKTMVTGLSKGIMILTGSTLNITGLDHIPDETVLFVGNHRSIFDIVLLLITLKRPFGFIGKDEVTSWPYINIVLRMMGGLFIDRSDNRKALKTILEGISMLKAGHSMLIFPEGTRNKVDTEPLPFKQGSLKLAEKANVPVVPFSLQGTDDIFENNNFYNIKKSTVNLHFGEPILLSSLPDDIRKKSGAYVRDMVMTYLNR